jgi:hypothetical protein
MGQQGYALTTKVDTEIVSAYAAAMQKVPAVASGVGWFKVGSFFVPKTLSQTRLEIIASVSAAGLTGTARLYDPTVGVDAPVSGSDVSFTGTDTARVLSGIIAVTGARTYFVLVQVVGATGADKFGMFDTATLVGP